MLRSDGKQFETHDLPTLYLSEAKPLAYVLNPKAACTLALNFLFYLNHGYRYFDPIQIHYSHHALLILRGEPPNPRAANAFCNLSPESFTFVRDPLQRFVSGFLSKVMSNDDELFLEYRDKLTSLHGIDLSPEADPARTALGFAIWLASHSDPNRIDPHFRPQYLNLRIGGSFTIDTILRLEDRAAILAHFSKWVGPDKAQWFLTQKFNEHTKFSKDDVITDELNAVVRLIYAKDYELFYNEEKIRGAA
jgi:hypothetical protein